MIEWQNQWKTCWLASCLLFLPLLRQVSIWCHLRYVDYMRWWRLAENTIERPSHSGDFQCTKMAQELGKAGFQPSVRSFNVLLKASAKRGADNFCNMFPSFFCWGFVCYFSANQTWLAGNSSIYFDDVPIFRPLFKHHDVVRGSMSLPPWFLMIQAVNIRWCSQVKGDSPRYRHEISWSRYLQLQLGPDFGTADSTRFLENRMNIWWFLIWTYIFIYVYNTVYINYYKLYTVNGGNGVGS